MSTQHSIPPLVTLGDPRLARPSMPLRAKLLRKPAFRQRLEILHQAMRRYGGIGIAAPQIGWFERFFLLTRGAEDDEDTEDEMAELPPERVETWINPRIMESSPEHCWAWEGCLSVPGLRGWIRRPAQIAVRGLNASGEPSGAELSGWDARVFQHEYDHLEGFLFPYRIQHPHHLVSEQAYTEREHWPPDWPAPQARDLPYGALVPE